MNEIITINNQPVTVKTYKGLRVTTFKDVDTVHNRPEGTARKRFNDNKERLIEGTEYFVLKTDEALSQYGIVAPNGLVVLSESGYLMLVKSFTDDLAWTVQRDLVNKYFRVPKDKKQENNEAKLLNARSRVSSQWLKIAQFVNIPEYKQICAHYASAALCGQAVLPLPQSEQHYYSAKEVGEKFGITSHRVGLIANKNNMKTEEYGKWFHDKSRYSSKEVDTFRYNDKAIERFGELLQEAQ